MSNDALADLGLDLGTDTTVAGSAEVVNAPVETPVVADASTAVVADTAVAADAATKAPREEVAIAEIETGFADFIPAQKRGGGGGSKYDKIETLVAPVAKEDGSGFKYAVATIKPEDATNFDEGRLTRSVQSAVTATNKSAKDEGRAHRYATRRAVVDGVFVGVNVYRVDGTLDVEEEAAS